MTLQEITQALFKKAKTMAGIFKLTPPYAHLISTLRLNKNRVNDTAPQQTQTSHINTPAGPLRFWGKEGKKEGKSAIDQICLSHPPTSCFNPLAGTSYITVPLFHLERDADLKQRLRDPNHLLVESKTDCIYIKKMLCLYVYSVLL